MKIGDEVWFEVKLGSGTKEVSAEVVEYGGFHYGNGMSIVISGIDLIVRCIDVRYISVSDITLEEFIEDYLSSKGYPTKAI